MVGSRYSGPLSATLSILSCKRMVQQIGFALWLHVGGFTGANCCISEGTLFVQCTQSKQSKNTNNNTKDSRKVTPSGTLEPGKNVEMRRPNIIIHFNIANIIPNCLHVTNTVASSLPSPSHSSADCGGFATRCRSQGKRPDSPLQAMLRSAGPRQGRQTSNHAAPQ